MHSLWIVGAVAAGIGFLLLGSWAVKSLWNWLSPTLNTPRIAFKHALAILVLSRILVGGIGGHRGFGGPEHWNHRNAFNGASGSDCEAYRHHSDRQRSPAAPLPGSADSTAVGR